MTRVSVPGSVLVLAALAFSGCGNSPVAPTVAPQNEVFGGTVAQQGVMEHHFTVTDSGAVVVTVLTVTRELPPEPDIPPDVSVPPGAEDQPVSFPPPIYIGLGIGTWNGATCSVIAQRTNASLFTTISGSALAGEFCVSVFDSGSVTDPVDYLLQVDHT
jgi:hypothetical protein